VANAKVLVVDANQDSRAALAHALTEAGYEAAVATSGSFALTMLEWEQPDLIVSCSRWSAAIRPRRTPRSSSWPGAIGLSRWLRRRPGWT
jgi:hypothetical protein